MNKNELQHFKDLDTEDVTKICMYLAQDVLTKSSNLNGVLSKLCTLELMDKNQYTQLAMHLLKLVFDIENYNKTLENVLKQNTTTSNISDGNGKNPVGVESE